VIKNIFECKADGRREVERSRLRCLEHVENYLGELKLKRWKGKENNKEK
jgi:hypothetical protein